LPPSPPRAGRRPAAGRDLTDSPKDTAGVVAQPPLLFLGFLAAGFVLDAIWPTAVFGYPWRFVVGGLLFVLGVLLIAAGIVRFSRAGTNVPTNRPTTALVTDGPYRYSRNPIYIALFLIYAGIGAAADNLWILALGILLFPILRYGVVAREERYLERKFGQAYLDYKAAVRRWL
jgi:protein-S-isoprenylcysteine O-methyltransferase Ste14